MHSKRQSHAKSGSILHNMPAYPGSRSAEDASSDAASEDSTGVASEETSAAVRSGTRRGLRAALRHAAAYLGIRAPKTPKHLVGGLAVLLSVVVLCLPSAYSVESPGPTANVLGKDSGKEIITVKGAKTYDGKGELRLVTVNASGVPGYPVTNAETLWAWINPNATVMPVEAVVSVGQTAEEYQQESEKEMSSSQDSATSAALSYASKQLGIGTDGVSVTMHVDDIGGPSAGMMYALGLIDKLTPADETGGKIIAGTGTMAKDGKVGAIGGIRMKMLGAKRDGATWFLAPESNCDEVVGHVPEGLRDVKVSTLDEAYQALVAIGEGKGDALPQCSAD